ncbi:hypothetical protein Celaphus_00018153 [Cervus elaphus hippelaphus]|uniref:Uncharacterized protein n=1 Tax=Cervus elaphus hippelaphus TaxID=46360 RepID=A0A212C5F8_CEREH|nr:hypothetical protein Celaphus_00018153 [Cervus elaphus hippelaphus]
MNAEPPEEKAASEAEAGAMPEKRAGSRAAGGNSAVAAAFGEQDFRGSCRAQGPAEEFIQANPFNSFT